MSTKNIIIGIVGLVIIFVGATYLSKRLSPDYKNVQRWKAAGVNCLPNGHSNLTQHIHQKLNITVDGAVENLPGNIGVAKNCLAELHTHDQAGDLNIVHLETVSADREMTLGQFFDVWGQSVDRSGYRYEFKVNGTTTAENPKDFLLKDGQTLDFIYTKLN